MIYVCTIIVHVYLKKGQTMMNLMAEIDELLRKVCIPWGRGDHVSPSFLASLEAVYDRGKSGCLTFQDCSQRLMFQLAGPQGIQGNEGKYFEVFERNLIHELTKRDARLQMIDYYGELQSASIRPQPAIPPLKKKFRVELSTLAQMAGRIEVTARDAQEAGMVALAEKLVHKDFRLPCF